MDAEGFNSDPPDRMKGMAHAAPAHQERRPDQEAAASSGPTAVNCTGRPGTMVEMACL